jgi:cell division protein ZapD
MNEVTYEQPLNERVRTLMRLEHLFQQVDHGLKGTSAWDNRIVLGTIIDILQTTSRTDLKSELIKELERLSSNLTPLANSNGVDQTKLNSILGDIDDIGQQLHSLQRLIAQGLRDNEFINAIKQRCSVPGGTSDFDLPAFHCWLQKDEHQQRATLLTWLGQLDLLRKAVDLILSLIRESARATRATATAGFYQQPLDANAPFQLVRVTLPANTDYFAEISGGKHRITIRFLTMTTEGRPTQVDQDIEFILTNCVI